ncbi:hypothetical protein KEM54_001630, partial [Ascosphaera aggregata]
RVSIRIKQADEIEHILVHKFTRFLTQRAENFFILRRKPVKGYDISFLITNFHTEAMLKHKLVDFIIEFMQEVDKEISEMKLFLNARARFVAESFLTPGFESTPAMPSLLQGRKHKAENRRHQGTPQPQSLATTAMQQSPFKEHRIIGNTTRDRMSSSKDTTEDHTTENITEPFPAFEDTPVLDIHHRTAMRTATHARIDGSEDAAHVFTPTHQFMTRERHRQVSDEVNPGLSGLCIGMGMNMSGSNNGNGKPNGKKSLLYGLGKRIWKNNKAKREAEVEVDVGEEVIEDSSDGGDVSVEDVEDSDGLPPVNTLGEQQQLEIIEEVIEPCQENVKNGNTDLPAEGFVAQDDVSSKAAKPSQPDAIADVPSPAKSALEVVEHDPLLWPSAMPFEKTAIFSLPHQWPVIRITNVPFTITKQEITQFLGRRSRPLLTDSGPAIHIIIERSTGKTMDCFVEFADVSDAQETLACINRNIENGQPVKLGTRHVHAEMSSQCEMMREMFPRAKCVDWKEGVPRVMRKKEGERWSTGFTGFVTEEEMFLTIRHAESPSRYPWYATTLYRVKDRNIMFTVTHRLLSILARRLHEMSHVNARHGHRNNNGDSSKKAYYGLDRRLAIDLLAAGLQCPGFNDRQKYCLHLAATNYSIITATPLSARFWPFDTLARKGHAQEPLMLKYAGLIRRAVEQVPLDNSLSMVNAFDQLIHAASPFGPIYLECNADLIFQDALDLELSMVRWIIAKGVKLLREEEAANAGVSLEMFEKPTINTSTPSNMQIPSVKEVIYQLLPPQWRSHHYGFDPESTMRQELSPGTQTFAPEMKADPSSDARATAINAEPRYANCSIGSVTRSNTSITEQHVANANATTASISYPSALEQTTSQNLESEFFDSEYSSYDDGPAELGHPRNRWSADLRRVDWKSADRRRSIGMKSRPVSMPEPIAEDSMSLG